MTSSCHHLDLVFGPATSPERELEPLPSPTSRLQPSNISVGSLFAMRHRGERLISPGVPLTLSEGSGRPLVVTGRMVGGGDLPVVSPSRPIGREVGRPRKVTMEAPESERNADMNIRRPFGPAVHRAGITRGEESLQNGRRRNSNPWKGKQRSKENDK